MIFAANIRLEHFLAPAGTLLLVEKASTVVNSPL
jgi:hypothetical protein